MLCLCEDCKLVYDVTPPELLAPEYAERRKELLRQIDERDKEAKDAGQG